MDITPLQELTGSALAIFVLIFSLQYFMRREQVREDYFMKREEAREKFIGKVIKSNTAALRALAIAIAKTDLGKHLDLTEILRIQDGEESEDEIE